MTLTQTMLEKLATPKPGNHDNPPSHEVSPDQRSPHSLHHEGEGRKGMTGPTGIQTNGIGTQTTVHLNLTRSLAAKPARKVHNRFGQKRVYERQKRIPFAGKE